MVSWLKQNALAVISVVSAVVLLFLSGILWASLDLPPASLARRAVAAVRDLRVNGAAYFGFVPLKHLRPRRFSGDGVVVSDAERAVPGVTFMTGLFGETLGARLYGLDGTLIHEWPINFFETAPDVMNYPFDALVHGDYLYPNGDILVNLDGVGLVRASACGDVLWQNRDKSHHSLFVDDEGFIWTPAHGPEYRESVLKSGAFSFDRVRKFDPDTGRKLDEIDLFAALVDSDLPGLALANNPIPGDMMHLNDVEVLSADMADAFPRFTTGDILVSSRYFNQIWVLDGASHLLKWWYSGPMVGQHDPDFQPDGTITLLDNHAGVEGGSRILKIDPVTGDHQVLYASDERNTFLTDYRGKHQIFENGNILITETDAGRVFEVTQGGDVVWSFINGWDEDRVAWVMSATRYPIDYASIGDVSCGER